jgi:hypothetical protein
MSESRILRQRTADLESARDNRRRGPCEGTQRCAVQVANSPTIPSGTMKTYLTNFISGFDSEDQESATFSANVESSQIIPVVFLGSTPVAGEMYVAKNVGGRWVAERDLCCPESTCTVTICTDSSVCSNGVFTPATGVTVGVTQGGTTIGSGVTPSGLSSSGCITLTIPASGSFAITTSSSRYADVNLTTRLACGQTVAISLDQATGTVCSCLALEPIPPLLTVTGGSGSATFSNGAFTLTAAVNALVPDNFGTCNGTIEANPCTTGGDLTVQFFPGNDPNACLSIVEQWTRSTDCNQSEGGPITTDDFSLYLNAPQGGFIEQWLNGPPSDVDSVCMGFFSQDDISTGNSAAGPFPVPLNVTINFPAGGFSSPPISSITITEPAAAPETVTAKFPPVHVQAVNALGALGRAAGQLLSGAPVLVSPEELERRLAICRACDQYRDERCLRCGCVVALKARLTSESGKCPLLKW